MKYFLFIALIATGVSFSVRAAQYPSLELVINNNSDYDMILKFDDPNPVCFTLEKNQIYTIPKKSTKSIPVQYSIEEYKRMNGDCDMDISFCTKEAEQYCENNDFELDLLDYCFATRYDPPYNAHMPVQLLLGEKDCTGSPRKTQVTFTNNPNFKKQNPTQKAQMPLKHKP